MHVEIVIAKTTEKVKNQKAQGFPTFQKIREILFFCFENASNGGKNRVFTHTEE